ncbi:MAG: hypothetical protein ACLP62_08820 [Acidimicrobiales bacterium]
MLEIEDATAGSVGTVAQRHGRLPVPASRAVAVRVPDGAGMNDGMARGTAEVAR